MNASVNGVQSKRDEILAMLRSIARADTEDGYMTAKTNLEVLNLDLLESHQF